MVSSLNTAQQDNHTGWFSLARNVSNKCLQGAVFSPVALTAIAAPIILGTAFFLFAGSESEEPSSELALITTTQSPVVGFLQDAALATIGTLQTVFLIWGGLGVGHHINKPPVLELPPSHFDEIEFNTIYQSTVVQRPRSKRTIIHIPQEHWSPEAESDSALLENVWQSQMRVFKKLREQLKLYPNAAVFQEGWSRGDEKAFYKPSIRQGELLLSYSTVIRAVFHEKVFDEMEKWDESRKYIFSEVGATRILYLLKEISFLHQSIDLATRKKIDEQIDREFAKGNYNPCEGPLLDLALGQREKALAKEVEIFFSKPENQDRQVIIVYGTLHDLSKYFTSENFERFTNEPSADVAMQSICHP